MNLSAILEKEGIPTEDQGISECENVPFGGVGFYSWKVVGEFPHLVHFWVKPEERSPSNMYRMMADCKKRFRSHGFKLMIVYAPGSGYVSRVVRAYARKEPYSRQHDQNYYLLGVDDYAEKQNT